MLRRPLIWWGPFLKISVPDLGQNFEFQRLRLSKHNEIDDVRPAARLNRDMMDHRRRLGMPNRQKNERRNQGTPQPFVTGGDLISDTRYFLFYGLAYGPKPKSLKTALIWTPETGVI